ncbi:MAG TPA: FAD-linked oxidase C-terminal domain-containing protein [Spirochaetota bacterium]|nr:FAD-linked oxidase C-terminal domain-containing protein [Spirochaetota bacterium]HPJ35290.1 FAD-linked oxidase C-terminal domain-containing protein [Spirochaetota bacterium]
MSSLGIDLRKILSNGQVLDEKEDLLAYANDATFYIASRPPDAVAVPRTTDEVSDVIRYANEQKIPVVPRGAGSGLAGGCTPVQGGIVLDMKGMNSIVAINRNNMTAEVEAGVVLDRFNRELLKQKLFYPPDPQSMKVCTIGGNVATRAGGPRGVKYGTTERYVTGLEVVLPDGSIITPGGKVVKQSSGYDLTHLFTGSEGTLGVVTKANLRLLPLPESSTTIVAACVSADQAAEIVSEIIAEGVVPAMLEFLIKLAVIGMNNHIKNPIPLSGEAYLLMEVDGGEAQVEAEVRKIKSICNGLGAADVIIVTNEYDSKSYWDARSKLYPIMMTLFKRVITEDVTVPRNLIPELVRRVQGIAASLQIPIGLAGHAGDGNMHPTIMHTEISEAFSEKAERAVEEIIKAGLDLSGTISGEHGIGIHKNRFLEMEHGPVQVALMKAIKNTIDPSGIMNPGKIWQDGGAL